MPWRTLMTLRQYIPVRLHQYVNHDPRLMFKARFVFKARPLLAQLRQTPGLYSRPEARLVFKARLLFEEIRYVQVWLNRIKDGWEKLCANKQTDKQTDRHYENNGHLAVNQLCCHLASTDDSDKFMNHDCCGPRPNSSPSSHFDTDGQISQ